MLFVIWERVRVQFWRVLVHVSGVEGESGGSQQDTPRIWFVVEGSGSVSLATWKIAFLIPQRQRAARESWFLCLLNWILFSLWDVTRLV